MPSGKGCLWKPMNDRVSLLVQSPSHVFLFATLWTEAFQAFLSLTISQSFSKFISLASVMPSSHLILWRSILLLPWIFPSTCPDFSSELAVQIRWPKYWSFSISPSKEYSGLISFRIDWFDLFSVQARILKRVAMPPSRGSSQPRDRTHFSRVCCTGRQALYH